MSPDTSPTPSSQPFYPPLAPPQHPLPSSLQASPSGSTRLTHTLFPALPQGRQTPPQTPLPRPPPSPSPPPPSHSPTPSSQSPSVANFKPPSQLFARLKKRRPRPRIRPVIAARRRLDRHLPVPAQVPVANPNPDVRRQGRVPRHLDRGARPPSQARSVDRPLRQEDFAARPRRELRQPVPARHPDVHPTLKPEQRMRAPVRVVRAGPRDSCRHTRRGRRPRPVQSAAPAPRAPAARRTA
jgi:hypothetical protein